MRITNITRDIWTGFMSQEKKNGKWGYFVDKYIKDNHAKVTDANRDTVMAGIAGYTGKAPIKREDLTDYLDGKVTLN
jgi:hypothetical protein